jgi:ABC-type amino acid transport system permease subunit
MNVLAYCGVLTMPAILWLAGWQLIGIRKICPFCMLVHIILAIEFVLLYKHLHFPHSALTTPTIITAAVVAFIISMFLAMDLLINEYYKKVELSKTVEFVKNTPAIIKGYLESKANEHFVVLPNELVYGNPEADNCVLFILSLGCKNCLRFVNNMNEIIACNNNIKVVLRFIGHDENQYIKTLSSIYIIYRDDKARALESIISLYDYIHKRKIHKWYSKFAKPLDDPGTNLLIRKIILQIKYIHEAPSVYYDNKYIHYYLHDTFVNYLKSLVK